VTAEFKLLAVLNDGRHVFRYQIDLGGGERNVVSLLEPDWVSRHGLNPLAVMAVLPAGVDLDSMTPDDVRENGPFLRLLSRVIFESADQCDLLRREAEGQREGYVFLLDGRTVDSDCAVLQEDMLGDLEVRDGVLVAGSYRHNPRHKLRTTAGWFRLPPEIKTALQARLRVPPQQ
jgi:hypothetical protein